MNANARWFLALGAFALAASVALGAAGMHGLKAHLVANDPAGWFRTALHYHQIHALGLLAVGTLCALRPRNRWFDGAGVLLLTGLLLFSVNLYLRSLLGFHALHAATPFGGMAFILGWLLLAIGALRSGPAP